jgi:16S rRNA (cytidine1402-2'-O)-methyltransferase
MNNKTAKNDFGALFIVATPIGNLEDITFRAIKILKEVDLIAAEDTRHSKKLLDHYGIQTPTISLHNFNEEKRSLFLLEKLQKGLNIALISDAGTPLISDPGFFLVKKTRDLQIKVVPIPGVSAVITALCAAGLPTDKFIFEGFLPAKKSSLKERLKELEHETRTLVFYEAPHRIMQLVDALLESFGESRYVILARELTKIFETIYGSPLKELKDWLVNNPVQQKGEFVVLVHGAKKITNNTDDNIKAMKVLKTLLTELPTKQAARLAAEITGFNQKELYKLAIKSNNIND